MGTKKGSQLRTFFVLVGITGLEPATSRPPDVCATNCAKSRSYRCKDGANRMQKTCFLLRCSPSSQVIFFEIACKGTEFF